MRGWVSAAVVVGVAVGLGVMLAGQVTGTPAEDFTRDPVVVAHLDWYVGSMSLLTSIVWGVGAALSAFVAWIEPRLRRELAPLAVLTAALGADDALLLHERVLPNLGVHEYVTQGLYALAGLILAWRMAPWRRGPAGVTGRMYVVGCAALAGSLLLDDVVHTAFLAEDTAKLIGALVFAVTPVAAHSALAGADAGADDRLPYGHRRRPASSPR
jgi:hypothetical protein